jgi:hypothetical protein
VGAPFDYYPFSLFARVFANLLDEVATSEEVVISETGLHGCGNLDEDSTMAISFARRRLVIVLAATVPVLVSGCAIGWDKIAVWLLALAVAGVPLAASVYWVRQSPRHAVCTSSSLGQAPWGWLFLRDHSSP